MTENKDRENYTRVTQVLYPFSGLDKIDPKIVENAGRRGTKVHKVCEAIADGLGEIGIDDEIRGYVDSFKQWWDQGINVRAMEQRFWDDELLFTGQVDFIVKTDEGDLIVDLKTSYRPSKTWQAQGSAYAYLAKNAGYNPVGIQFIHLKKTGKPPKIIEYPVDDSLFLSIFRAWKHFYG